MCPSQSSKVHVCYTISVYKISYVNFLSQTPMLIVTSLKLKWIVMFVLIDPQGELDITASFHNFSYESANNSRKNSLDSAAEGTGIIFKLFCRYIIFMWLNAVSFSCFYFLRGSCLFMTLHNICTWLFVCLFACLFLHILGKHLHMYYHRLFFMFV